MLWYTLVLNRVIHVTFFFVRRALDCSVQIHDDKFSFMKKRKNGTVDVWWLVNDGGIDNVINIFLNFVRNANIL